jgi:hypothetical protein
MMYLTISRNVYTNQISCTLYSLMETNDPITILPGLTIGQDIVNQQILRMNLYITICWNGYTNLS